MTERPGGPKLPKYLNERKLYNMVPQLTDGLGKIISSQEGEPGVKMDQPIELEEPEGAKSTNHVGILREIKAFSTLKDAFSILFWSQWGRGKSIATWGIPYYCFVGVQWAEDLEYIVSCWTLSHLLYPMDVGGTYRHFKLDDWVQENEHVACGFVGMMLT